MTETPVKSERKLSVVEHIACALPLGLIAVGGALGGAFGGLAWAVNQRIMRSNQSAAVRYLFVFLTLIGAILAYFAGVFVLVMIFPGLFNSQ